MGQLGVVVVAQNVRQRVRRRVERVDMRMRIDQHEGVELVEQALAKLLAHRSFSRAGMKKPARRNASAGWSMFLSRSERCRLGYFRSSSPRLAIITSAPEVMLRIFAAITDFSDGVAFSSLRLII